MFGANLCASSVCNVKGCFILRINTVFPENISLGNFEDKTKLSSFYVFQQIFDESFYSDRTNFPNYFRFFFFFSASRRRQIVSLCTPLYADDVVLTFLQNRSMRSNVVVRHAFSEYVDKIRILILWFHN